MYMYITINTLFVVVVVVVVYLSRHELAQAEREGKRGEENGHYYWIDEHTAGKNDKMSKTVEPENFVGQTFSVNYSV